MTATAATEADAEIDEAMKSLHIDGFIIGPHGAPKAAAGSKVTAEERVEELKDHLQAIGLSDDSPSRPHLKRSYLFPVCVRSLSVETVDV